MTDELGESAAASTIADASASMTGKKSWLDVVKEWSGIVTFFLAILYTFPLGVWDRFIVTKEEADAKEVNQLRDLVIKMGELDADYFKTSASLTDQYANSYYTNAMSQQKITIVARSIDLINRRYASLTPMEQAGLATQLESES